MSAANLIKRTLAGMAPNDSFKIHMTEHLDLENGRIRRIDQHCDYCRLFHGGASQ